MLLTCQYHNFGKMLDIESIQEVAVFVISQFNHTASIESICRQNFIDVYFWYCKVFKASESSGLDYLLTAAITCQRKPAGASPATDQ